MDTSHTKAIHERAWAKQKPPLSPTKKSAGLLHALAGILFKPRMTLTRLIDIQHGALRLLSPH
ncbi:MAG: hypothetical protein P1S60_14115 [Anaerolineae bacterium]|nr:hypothetical protein [Anaerolineae bacterium]